jgi:hypothetical protein
MLRGSLLRNFQLITVIVPFQNKYFSSFKLRYFRHLKRLHPDMRNHSTKKTGRSAIGRIEEPML